MFFGVMEHDRQHKGTRVRLHWHPFICEQHARAAVYTDDMMIVMDQLFCLLTRANGNSLVGVDLIE